MSTQKHFKVEFQFNDIKAEDMLDGVVYGDKHDDMLSDMEDFCRENPDFQIVKVAYDHRNGMDGWCLQEYRLVEPMELNIDNIDDKVFLSYDEADAYARERLHSELDIWGLCDEYREFLDNCSKMLLDALDIEREQFYRCGLRVSELSSDRYSGEKIQLDNLLYKQEDTIEYVIGVVRKSSLKEEFRWDLPKRPWD